MLVLEMIVGIGGGLGSAVSGIWSKASGGFFQPMLGTSLIAVFTLLLLPLLPNSQNILKEKQVNKVKEDKENTDKDLLQELQYKSICVFTYFSLQLNIIK